MTSHRRHVSAAKVHLVSLWPWPLTSDLENLYSNGCSHVDHKSWPKCHLNLSTMCKWRHIARHSRGIGVNGRRGVARILHTEAERWRRENWGGVFRSQNRLLGLGERRDLPQRGPGRSPSRQCILAYLRPTEHFW